MRRVAGAVLALLAAACGRSVTVTGTIDDDAGVEAVWHYEGDERSGLEADSFRLEGLRGDPIDLRFTGEDGLHARMEIRGAPAGGRIRLTDVWIEDGVAYPSHVALDGADFVVVNGLRMGDPGAWPAEVDVEGVVLAAGRSGGALVVRPLDDGLPDLRVVVTPATGVVSRDGEPVPGGAASTGDTVRVAGTTSGGYVIATELVLPRAAAVQAGDREGDSDGPPAASEREQPDSREQEGRGRGRGQNRGRGKGRGG